ncbi:hypothetical protein nbrc107696_19100 [Gordonia spumicola]|uniref:Uncharacterized protein n=1 Tax=Gordonia spumicola TaxID=589161 RepID=A0A7I9V8A8_9ACTN|nr:hypothetical protein nbrc107696_19100 [Gordonia spumicola]
MLQFVRDAAEEVEVLRQLLRPCRTGCDHCRDAEQRGAHCDRKTSDGLHGDDLSPGRHGDLAFAWLERKYTPDGEERKREAAGDRPEKDDDPDQGGGGRGHQRFSPGGSG